MDLNESQTLSTRNSYNTGFLSYLGYSIILVVLLFLCREALAFDLEKGIKASTDPLLGIAQNHWGKLVVLVGVATAIVGEGDLRMRAIKAGVGVGVASGVILGMLAAYT